ncbi:MAG: DnaD domain protein [Clostridia bacterium]|nr:DnaD domain protein [Clostridia bacterium]
MTEYKINLSSLNDNMDFKEATAEELRVLLAVISLEGRVDSQNAIARLASTSAARARASLVFWEDSGVISAASKKKNDTPPTVTEEFEDSGIFDDNEKTAVELVKSIRDNNLKELFEIIAGIIEKPTLERSEIKKISELYEDEGLEEDYIINLAGWMKDKGKVTVSKIYNKARALVKHGILSSDDLDDYIKAQDSITSSERMFIKTFRIKNPILTDNQRMYIKRWVDEFGFGEKILLAAFNYTVDACGELSYSYMNKLLVSWHEAGCKTVDDCNAEHERRAAELSAEYRKPAPRGKRAEKTPLRYGDFDVEDAFAKALERSYGTDETTD